MCHSENILTLEIVLKVWYRALGSPWKDSVGPQGQNYFLVTLVVCLSPCYLHWWHRATVGKATTASELIKAGAANQTSHHCSFHLQWKWKRPCSCKNALDCEVKNIKIWLCSIMSTQRFNILDDSMRGTHRELLLPPKVWWRNGAGPYGPCSSCPVPAFGLWKTLAEE